MVTVFDAGIFSCDQWSTQPSHHILCKNILKITDFIHILLQYLIFYIFSFSIFTRSVAVTAQFYLGAVQIWYHAWWGRGGLKIPQKAWGRLIKSVKKCEDRGRGGKNLPKKAWYHIWTAPYVNIVVTVYKYLSKLFQRYLYYYKSKT